MKKLFIALFCLILIAAGGLGGYFIGKNYSNQIEGHTFVAEKLDKFCKAATWTEDEDVDTKNKVATADDEEMKIDYNGDEAFIKAFVLFTKKAFEGELKQNQYYYSAASYQISGNNYYGGKMSLYFTINKGVADIYIKDINNNTTVKLNLDNKYNDSGLYTLKIYSFKNWNLQNGLSYAEVTANSEKVVKYSHYELYTDKTDYKKLEMDDITNLVVYECDTITKKQLKLEKSAMTDEQKTEYKTTIYDAFKNYYEVGFNYIEYTEIDALKEMYKDLGYAVQE